MNRIDSNKYLDILDKIENCLDWYFDNDMPNTRYKLFLSNNDRLEIDFGERALSHLLGVNINYLRSTGHYIGGSSSILDDILKNPKLLLSRIKDGYIKEEQVFSKHIDKKLANFKNICILNVFNIEFIVKYESEKSYITGEDKLEGDYYIVTKDKLNKDKISIIGLKLNKNGLYQPMTNMQFEEYSDEYRKFFNQVLKGQTITIAQTLIKNVIDDYGNLSQNKYFYDTSQKIGKIKNIKRYAEEYKAIINVSEDCIFYIDKVQNLYDEKNKTIEIIKEITDKISSNCVIDAVKLDSKYGDIPNYLLNLIGSHNDSLSKKDSDKNNNESYTELITSLKTAKADIEKKDILIKKLDDNNKELIDRNQILEEENNILKDKVEKIRAII